MWSALWKECAGNWRNDAWQPANPYTSGVHHREQDRMSMELSRAIASGLKVHPEWIDVARANLDRWEQRNAHAPGLVRCYREWRGLLELPLEPPIVRQMALIVHKDRKQNPNVERVRAALLTCANIADGDNGATVAKLETHRRARR